MTVPTLLQLIEEEDVRKVVCTVIIGGAVLPKWTSVDYNFSIGQVPTCTITVPSRDVLPASVVEEASVQVWFGFQVGLSVLDDLVFGGAVVDSVGNNGAEVVIDCVMDGPRKLSYSYNRRIDYEFEAVQASEAVLDLLTLAGVSNYYVELDPWVLGTAVPQTIEFSTYGEAINKIAEVDGTPWYAMPTGQVRVDKRDPIPSASARRTYFSGILTGPIETAPTAITNAAARPRINDISRRKYRAEVANFIHVEGAVVVSLGPNGEQNSNQIEEEVDGASGQFPNGAYWIPTPPLFQDFTFSNELIDTPEKAFVVAERYFDIKNRLFEKIPLPIPGEPDVFLGATVRIVDPRYSGVSSLYFVEGYSTHISPTDCTTELQLTGGDESGTTGFAAPFADFIWTYTALHNWIPDMATPGGDDNAADLDLGPGADQGAKLCQDVPEGTGDEEQGGDFGSGEDKRTVIIGIDGTVSKDFDGYIVSWAWTWTDSLDVEHNLTGPRITLIIDPDLQSSVDMTLEVTDDSGRTASITKTIYTNADYLGGPESGDPSMNDTSNGGGEAAGECTDPPEDVDPPITPPPNQPQTNEPPPGACTGLEAGYYIAAGSHAMGTLNNRDWNDLTKEAAGVAGDFISVASAVNNRTQRKVVLFGTSLGEVVISEDVCVTGQLLFTVPGSPRIETIHFDTTEMGVAAEGDEYTEEGGYYGDIPVYTQGSPGTMTMLQAYQQALAVGFDPTSAVVAVAIMKAESGLVSNASNSSGNTPPSTDRGIAQINSYWHPEVTDAQAYNTAQAIAAMYTISSGGTDYTPWTVYTVGAYRQYLSAVQEAVGFEGEIGDSYGGSTPYIPRSFKVWLGTSDGRVYVSETSGREWTLWRDFADGYPIYAIITSQRFKLGDNIPPLMVFGGNSANPASLIRIAVSGTGDFEGLPIEGDLRTAIAVANSGDSVRVAKMNATSLMIGFSGDITPLIWFSLDPIGDPESWTPSTGETNASVIRAAAPGFDGFYVAVGDAGVFTTADNAAFTAQAAPPYQINHLLWQGLPGAYLAASNGGLLSSLDYGVGWGVLRPNAEFGTTWPVGAIGYQVAFSVGPRECNGGDIEDVVFSGDPFTNGDQLVSSASFDVTLLDDSPDVMMLVAITSHQAVGTPDIPTITSENSLPDNVVWQLVESVTFGVDSHNRLTMWKGFVTAQVIAEGFTTVTIEFGGAQQGYAAGSVMAINATGDPVIQSATATSDTTISEITVSLGSPIRESSIIYSVCASWDNSTGNSSDIEPMWTPDPPIRPDYLFLVNGGPDNDYYNNLGGAVKRPVDYLEPISWHQEIGLTFDMGAIAVELRAF